MVPAVDGTVREPGVKVDEPAVGMWASAVCEMAGVWVVIFRIGGEVLRCGGDIGRLGGDMGTITGLMGLREEGEGEVWLRSPSKGLSGIDMMTSARRQSLVMSYMALWGRIQSPFSIRVSGYLIKIGWIRDVLTYNPDVVSSYSVASSSASAFSTNFLKPLKILHSLSDVNLQRIPCTPTFPAADCVYISDAQRTVVEAPPFN